MNQDRLAAMRAQREQGSFRGANPADGAYEMHGLPEPAGAYALGSPVHDGGMAGFDAEAETIEGMLREFEASVARIGQLHAQSLSLADPAGAARQQAALDEHVAAARALSNDLKARIQGLEAQPATGPAGRMQKNRVALLKKRFVEYLQRYQDVEREYRAKSRARVERQFKLVKPDATQDEVNAVVNDTSGSGGQVFAQALSQDVRGGESRVAYREVQERHQEILRIEQNIAELAQLMNDMSVLVAQADEQLYTIETAVEGASKDLESGNKQLDDAINSARRARRLKWACFIIVIVILIIIAIVLAIHFSGNNNK